MRAILDLLLPTLCPACRHADGPGLCAPCIDAIPRLDLPCPWCGYPLGVPLGMGEPQQAAPPLNAPPGLPPGIQGAVEAEEKGPYSVRKVCYRCRGHGFPHIHSVAVTAAYAGVIKSLVTAAKASGRPAAVRALAAVVADPPPAWPADAVVTPVPPAPGRRPGPHLATALAKAIAKRTHRPCARLLHQTRTATPQHRLAGHARHANVIGLFASNPKIPAPKAVILVDDLLTSGATITAAAATLHAAGAGKIFALILARSPNRNDPPTLGAPWAGADDAE